MDHKHLSNSGPLQNSRMEPFAKVVIKVILKPLTILAKVPVIESLRGSRRCLCRTIQQSFQNSNRDVPLSASN